MGVNKLYRIIRGKVLIVSVCILVCKRETGESWLMLGLTVALDPHHPVLVAPRQPRSRWKPLHRPCHIAWTWLLQTLLFKSPCVLAETPAQASPRCGDGMGQWRDADVPFSFAVCQGHVKETDENLVPVVLSTHFGREPLCFGEGVYCRDRRRLNMDYVNRAGQ